MIGKLKWERSNLFCRERHDVTGCQYIAFNCAVTAWHVTDWLWHDITSELKTELKLEDFAAFQKYVCDSCSALKLCREIANGSKHRVLRTPHLSISALVTDGEGYDYGNPVIDDGEKHHMADDVFGQAQIWFEEFIRIHQIFPAEPFVPADDGSSLAAPDRYRAERAAIE